MGPLLGILFILVLMIVFYIRYKLTYWKRRGVVQLSADYIFGNFKEAILFRIAPGWHLGNLHRFAKSELPYIGFYVFHKRCLLLRDPEIIKRFLIRDSDYFSDRHFAGSVEKDSFGMRNLFGLNNPTWKYVRTKISPTLASGKLKRMFPLITENGQSMMDYLRRESDQNGVKIVNIHELYYKYAIDLTANIALGTKINSFENPNLPFSKSVLDYFHSFKRTVALNILFFMPEIVRIIEPILLLNPNFIRKIFCDTVVSREQTGIYRGDLIDSLIELKNIKQNHIYKFEGDNLLYQSGMFFSGFESSSITATFTLMELARRKVCQEKARDDILRAIEKHGWTIDAFSDMKYLDKCVAEAARIYPPISTIDRFTTKDYPIPGTDIIIEKHTPVYVSLYGLQQDVKYFDQPEIFRPERYDKDRIISIAFPFGLGPRACVGMKLGQLHTKLAVAMVLKEYDVDVYHKPDVQNVLDRWLTLNISSGLKLELKKL